MRAARKCAAGVTFDEMVVVGVPRHHWFPTNRLSRPRKLRKVARNPTDLKSESIQVRFPRIKRAAGCPSGPRSGSNCGEAGGLSIRVMLPELAPRGRSSGGWGGVQP
jgi:hypothetical protein